MTKSEIQSDEITVATDAEEAGVKGEALARALADLASEKKAEDVTLLDVRGISTVTDFIVLCSGTSIPHLKAIRKHLATAGRKLPGATQNAIDGNVESQWLVVDYWDVMVHIFHPDMREHYALEDLWGDGKKLDWKAPELPGAGGQQS